MQKVFKRLVPVVLLAMLLLAACNKGGSSTAQGPVKVGLIVDLSGPLALPGQELQEGIQMAVDEANAGGGVLGREVKLLIEDVQSKPDVALRKAEKLVKEDGVRLFIGVASSGVGLALAPKLPEWKALTMVVGAKSPKLTGEAWNPYVFRAARNDAQDILAISAWLDQHPELKNWFLLGADYEWGRTNVAAFKKLLQAKGRTVVNEVYPEFGAKDYGPQITKALEKQPDAVWAALSGGDAINFLKQAKSFGLSDKTQIVGVLLLSDSVVGAAGPAAAGVIGNVQYNAGLKNDQNAEFTARFAKKYGHTPSNFDADGYIGMKLMLAAVQKAKSAESKDVIKALEGAEMETPVGPALMRAEDHQLITPTFIGKVVPAPGEKSGVKIEVTATVERSAIAVPLSETGLPKQ